MRFNSLFRRRRQAPIFSREQIFNSRPRRHPSLEWSENEEGIVTLTITRRNDRWSNFLAFVFVVPDSRHVQLDEVGSQVWKLCDGDTTIDDMVSVLARKYKLNRKEAEVSLTTFLKDLAKRRYIAFEIDLPDHLVAAKNKRRQEGKKSGQANNGAEHVSG